MALAIRCPQFGTIANVRLGHDEAASLAAALTAIVLDHGTAAWDLADDAQ